MRLFLLCLAFAVHPSFADAYKYKSVNGQVVFTEKPCEVGQTLSRAVKSEFVDSQRAQMDLERQRGWLAGREQMHRDDAINAHEQAMAVDRAYPQEIRKTTKSASIFDKPWGCGNRSCSKVSSTTRR